MPSGQMILLVCAGLLLSGGVILCISTAFALIRMSYLFWTSDAGAELTAAILIVVGSGLCLPVCWLSSLVPSYPRSQSLIGTLLVVSSAALVVLSLGLSSNMSLSALVRDHRAFNASMHRALAKVPLNLQIRNSFNAMQLEMMCCGIQSPNDWYEYTFALPPSCCNRKSNSKDEEEELCLTPEFVGGCLSPALMELRKFINVSCIIGSILTMVLGVVVVVLAYMIVSGMERAEQRASKLKAAAQAHVSRLLYAHAHPAPTYTFDCPPPPPPSAFHPAQGIIKV